MGGTRHGLRAAILLASSLGLALTGGTASAQNFPSKPIRLLSTIAGASDVLRSEEHTSELQSH